MNRSLTSVWRSFLSVGLLSVMMLPNGRSSVWADNLDQATEKVAVKITEFLKKRDQSALSLSPFQGPSQLMASSGAGIVQAFKRHFDNAGIQIQADAPIGLQGRFHLNKRQHEAGVAAVTIRGSLVDRFGEVLTEFTYSANQTEAKPGEFETQVEAPEDVAKTLGATASLHPEDTDKDRQKDLVDAIDQPKAHLSDDGRVALAGDGAPFGVEVIVGRGARPMSVRNGRPFVSISRDETYTLRIINQAQHETAVEVSIDGVSSFAFSEEKQTEGENAGKPKFRYYIIGAGESMTVLGWHRSLREYSEFKITPYEQSASALAGLDQSTLGIITVTFAAAWPKGGSPPRDESAAERSVRDATGFGATKTQSVQPVSYDIGRLRGSVSIRYDL